MALAVYNGRVYQNDLPWKQIFVKDEITNSVYEIVLINGLISLSESQEIPLTYSMFDLYTSLNYEFTIVNGKLGLKIFTSEFNIGDGFRGNYVKLGSNFYIHIKSNIKDSIDRIEIIILDNNDNIIIKNNVNETVNGYITETVISNVGEYTILAKIKGYGYKMFSISIIEDTIIDLNNKIPFIHESLIRNMSKSYI